MATYTSPSKQHEEQAQKILARRGASKNNDKPAPKKTKVPAVTPTVTKTPEKVEEAKIAGATVNPYEGKGVKDLRAMCDAREPAIKYKKKDTIAKLIEKLTA